MTCGVIAIVQYQHGGQVFFIVLTISGPGFRGCLGPGGRVVISAYNSKTIHGIQMKFGRVVENHKLINAV